ncbi:Leucine-rich repeat [Macleaya cordata]|uniref:Leucine-rich repeat n=1 Tax=Macleaya cordata TaxID=56857 RepID=A0A200QA29_MACCD|nr:Leucine-rich repeat [Macleaya cordata]
MGIRNLPSEIKELIHLRYLDLSYNLSLKELPDSICSLYNLQTLKLKGCSGLRILPREMGRMIDLKHLDVDSLISLPEGIGKLTSLQTLKEFIVDGASGGCKIEELKDLNLLQGCICIRGLGSVKSAKEASEAELMQKLGLCRLVLDFSTVGGMAFESEGNEENLDAPAVEIITGGVLVVLQPHPNLKELCINSYLGWNLPSWIASLNHLRILNLYNCVNCTELPALGLLASLEKLILGGLDNLKRIGVEIYGNGGGQCVGEVAFPKLKELDITANKLEVWDMGDGEVAGEIMPCVTRVTLKCRKLKVLPPLWKLPSLETLDISYSAAVTHIGPEFYGISGNNTIGGGGGGNVNLTAFPNLKSLRMTNMEGLEEFDLGVDVEGGGHRGKIIIMPRLNTMTIDRCFKLKTLRALSKLQSLEVLRLRSLHNLEEFKTGVHYELISQFTPAGTCQNNYTNWITDEDDDHLQKMEETGDHLLLHFQYTTYLWSYFLACFSENWIMPKTVMGMLHAWRGNQRNVREKLVRKVLLPAVWWVTWNERNKRKFDDRATCVERVIIKIKALIFYWEYSKRCV